MRDILDSWQLPDGSSLNVNIWPDWFEAHPGMETFQSLDLAAKTAEWAILVFSADDLRRRLSLPSFQEATVRDNVLFELGLFYGYLGADRVFILEQAKRSRRKVRIASDIHGIQRYQFSDEETFRAVLRKTREKIDERSKKPFLRWVPAASLAMGYLYQALIPFIEQRRQFRRQMGTGRVSPFKVEVLIPTRSFEGMSFGDVRARFEDAGYKQVTPDGRASGGRPAMWVPHSTKGACAIPTFFDIPTTLFTVQKVVREYLSSTAEAREVEQLVASQALDFERVVKRENVYGVETKTTCRTVDEITKYLEGRSTA